MKRPPEYHQSGFPTWARIAAALVLGGLAGRFIAPSGRSDTEAEADHNIPFSWQYWSMRSYSLRSNS